MREWDKVDKIIKIDYTKIETRYTHIWHLQRLRALNRIPDYIPNEQVERYINIKKGGEKIG